MIGVSSVSVLLRIVGCERPSITEPSVESDSDAPPIAALAQQVAGSAPGAYAAAKLLSDHVHGLLEKAYGASHDRASDVLAAGEGE